MRTILFTNVPQCAGYDRGGRHIKTPSTLSNFRDPSEHYLMKTFSGLFVCNGTDTSSFSSIPVNLFRGLKCVEEERKVVKTFPLADSGIRGIVGYVRGMMTLHFTFYDKIKLLAHFLKRFLPSEPLVAAPKMTGNVKPIFQCKGKQWTMEAIEVHYKSLKAFFIFSLKYNVELHNTVLLLSKESN